MRTKWGTCNIDRKRIWINLQLAKKTPECLAYVVTHELVHLLERNHNEQFQKYMGAFFPGVASSKGNTESANAGLYERVININ